MEFKGFENFKIRFIYVFGLPRVAWMKDTGSTESQYLFSEFFG